MRQYIRFFTFAMMAVMGLSFASCGSDDDDDKKEEAKYSDISLTCDDKYKIPGSGDETWTSSNKYIASVSEDNVVTAKLVGEAVVSSSKGSFKVNVSSRNNVFNDPCLEWGASKSKVKSFHGNSTPATDTDTGLAYKYAGGNAMTAYIFESGALVAAGVRLTSKYTSSESLADHLTDRYIPVTMDEENYSFYFVAPDKKTTLMLTLETSGRDIIYMITYIPSNNDKTKSGIPCHDNIISAMKVSCDSAPSDAAAGEFSRIRSMLKM